MDDLAIARALHILAIIIWIGGVAMITSIVLPAAGQTSDSAAFFEAIEDRFAFQARGATLLAGASGFYMTVRLELWDRFAMREFWWMSAMVGVWLLFTVILFVAEPLFLNRWFAERARRDPAGTMRLIHHTHWLLLLLSLITAFGAVAGSHGLYF